MEPHILTWPVSDDVAGRWDELADDVGAWPFLRPGWIGAWWRAFGRGRLDVLTILSDGRLVAVLPMVRLPMARLSPTNWHTPRFGMLARDDQAAAEAARSLFAQRAPHVSLSFLDAADPTLATMRAEARSSGYRLLQRTLVRPWYVRMDGEWETYRRQRLGKRLRGKLERTRRRLEELGEVSFEMGDGGEDLDRLLSEIYRVEASGWKGTRGTAIASRPETERFYREVARWARDRGVLRLSVLRLDGVVIAGEIALHEAGHHLGLKAGFDGALARFGPGMLLLRDLIREDFERGLTTFEFLGDEAEWKERWSTGRREVVRVQAFAPSALGVAHFSAYRYGRPAAFRARALVDRIRERGRRTRG
jgi:CelD/BcsL family acetyltransferase involved in cellulose biosynthesis